MSATPSLDSLYRETLLEHSTKPRNFGVIDGPDRQATGHNPLCGDKVTVYLRMGADGRIHAAAFEGTGCAISTASASMLTEHVRGLDRLQATALAGAVDKMVTDRAAAPLSGDLAALAGVRDYPSRIRCASLAWRTLEAALRNDPQPVTTED